MKSARAKKRGRTTKRKEKTQTSKALARGRKTAKKLTVVKQPEEFFQQQVCKALDNQKVSADPNTEFYLVNLLSHFMHAKNYFTVDENGDHQEEVLATLLCNSLSDSETAVREKGLKRLGDITLYTAGFFSDRLSRKIVDVDYYIGMGKNAYSHLADAGSLIMFQKVFGELSVRFHQFVDVLSEVSENVSTRDANNILRTYELWLKTQSKVAEKNLRDAGIIPNQTLKTEPQ